MAPPLSALVRHLNPFVCMGSDGGSKKAAAEKRAVREYSSSGAGSGESNVEAAGNLQGAGADRSAAAVPVPATTSVGHPKRRKTAAGDKVKHKGAAAAGGTSGGGSGGVMPWRPLYSYDLDPIANCMYFYGSVGGITC